MTADMLSRAQGCLLGQLAGDSLGSLVEFRSAREIRASFPGGVRRLAAGGVWDTLAGQPTDDSEMALLLARLLVERGGYDPEGAREAYLWWLASGPFDCGATISRGLRGRPDAGSQANGALMRISPWAFSAPAATIRPPSLPGPARMRRSPIPIPCAGRPTRCSPWPSPSPCAPAPNPAISTGASLAGRRK